MADPHCLSCSRLSPFLFLSSLLILLLLLLQLDFAPQLLPLQLQAWHSHFSLILHRLASPALPESPPPPPSLLLPSSFGRTPPCALPNGSRLAVCLVGGARAFELTGPTIKEYLLQEYNNTDVFLHSPLDKDARKLALLKDTANLVHVRIFTPQALPVTRISSEVLTASNSPNGVQGLLQYFNLVEGCIDMIKQYQLDHGFTYEWIIRTRLDGYWNEHLPPLEKMDHSAYTVPLGSQFGGLNDRLGVGNWETSKVALARVSLLPALHAHGLRGLNSETSFRKQLKVRNVTHKFMKFPFCILSHRTYAWPPGRWGVPVLSISSKGHLNGAKCRPCTHAPVGEVAKQIAGAQERSWAWTGITDGLELCKATGDWEKNWEDVFDRVAGPESAESRRKMLRQNLSDCIELNEAFKKQVKFWDAPSPTVICEKGLAS